MSTTYVNLSVMLAADPWVRRVRAQIRFSASPVVAPRIGLLEALFACSGPGVFQTAEPSGRDGYAAGLDAPAASAPLPRPPQAKGGR